MKSSAHIIFLRTLVFLRVARIERLLSAQITEETYSNINGWAYLKPDETLERIVLSVNNTEWVAQLGVKTTPPAPNGTQAGFSVQYKLPHGQYAYVLTGFTKTGKKVPIANGTVAVSEQEALESKVTIAEKGNVLGWAYLRSDETLTRIILSAHNTEWEAQLGMESDSDSQVPSGIRAGFLAQYELPHGQHDYSLTGITRAGTRLSIANGTLAVSEQEVLEANIIKAAKGEVLGWAYLKPGEALAKITLSANNTEWEALLGVETTPPAPNNLKTGFRIQYELPNGSHPYSLTGTTVSGRRVEITKGTIDVSPHECLSFFIDRAKEGKIRGWCFAKISYKVKGIKLKVGSQIFSSGPLYPRPDVKNHFKREDALDSGFKINYFLPDKSANAEIYAELNTGEDVLLTKLFLEQSPFDEIIYCLNSARADYQTTHLPFEASLAVAAAYNWIPLLGCALKKDAQGFNYSDGDEIEEYILHRIFASKDITIGSEELAAGIKDWPSQYHLSSQRANLLLPFKEALNGKSVLELGAGCGAMTRAMGEFGANVTAIEGSLRRAAIAAARCRDLPNVRVFCDNINCYPEKGSFDVVTLIGVLEYARVYGDNDDPIQTLLNQAKTYLKKDGVLILAIENQLGLKYFCGAEEDHMGEPMRGINDAYASNTPVTFGKVELENRLKLAGFPSIEAYFPFPDYKLPVLVLGPRATEKISSNVLGDLISGTVNNKAGHIKSPLFSLQCAWPLISRNALVEHLANSFLLVARKSSNFISQTTDVLAWYYGFTRKKGLNKTTLFKLESDESVSVLRINDQAEHAQTAETPQYKVEWQNERCIDGTLWTRQLIHIMNRPKWSVKHVSDWGKVWLDILFSAAQIAPDAKKDDFIDGRFLDAAPFNLIITKGKKPIFIDLEWQAKHPIPIGAILFRNLFFSLCQPSSVLEPLEGTPIKIFELTREVSRELGFPYTEDEAKAWMEIIRSLEEFVFGRAHSNFQKFTEFTLPTRSLKPNSL